MSSVTPINAMKSSIKKTLRVVVDSLRDDKPMRENVRRAARQTLLKTLEAMRALEAMEATEAPEEGRTEPAPTPPASDKKRSRPRDDEESSKAEESDGEGERPTKRQMVDGCTCVSPHTVEEAGPAVAECHKCLRCWGKKCMEDHLDHGNDEGHMWMCKEGTCGTTALCVDGPCTKGYCIKGVVVCPRCSKPMEEV